MVRWHRRADPSWARVVSAALTLGLLLLVGWGMVLAIPIMTWDRRLLRRDVHGWLRQRGVECPVDVAPHVLWVQGGVGIGGENTRIGFHRTAFTAVVVTPATIVIESQWPLWPWRRRLVVDRGTVLRHIEGRIADPRRHCLVVSNPPERLLGVLRASAWEIKDVPF